MADFDPDKFLSETSNTSTATVPDQGGFDPDKFIAETSGGGGQQPAHVQNLMSRLGPLLMSGAKAAVGPRFVQAGKDIAAGAAARSERTERSPTLPEQALSGLGEAAGLAVGVPWELGKAAIGTTADAIKSITPQPVQQAIQPAAQATESGLQKVVRGIGNIPLPGGNKVSDIPAGAVETWKQLPQRAKDITSSVGDISMVAPVGKGTQLLAKGAEKFGQDVVAPIAERMAKKDVLQEQVKTDEQIAKAVKKGISKGIKPTDNTLSGTGKKTFAKQKQFYTKAQDAVQTIADNRDAIKITDENGELTPHPRSSAEMAQAIDQTKKVIYKQYHDMALAAGDKGAQFETAPIIAQIDKVAQDLKENPETRKYAESLTAEIQELQGQSPEIVEARIKDLNSSLAGFYDGRVTKAKARIDGSVANLMREELDNKITGAVGEGYQALKNKYGSLKAIEKDVNHRAIVNARKAGKSIIDMTDIFTGGDLAAGVLTMNPMLIAKGVAGRGLKELYKAINNPDRAVAAMFKKVYGLSDKIKAKTPIEDVVGRIKGKPAPQPSEAPAPQGTMQTQFIPGQEPTAPAPKSGIPQAVKNLGNEGGYIDLGGASAPVEPPPTAPKVTPGTARNPQQELIDKIRGEKPQYTPEQVESVARFQTERDAAMKEIDETKGLSPDDLLLRKTDKSIDLFRKHGILWDEGRQQYVFNSQQPDVDRFWDSFGYPGGQEGLAVSQRSEKLRSEIEANLASEQLPRGAEVPPVEGAPSQSSEVAQGESKPPQDVLPQGSETEPQSSLSPEDQATQDRLTRIAERKERKPGEVYTHDLTDNPQANRVLWRDNVRRQVKWHIDHDENGTLRDDRKDQWAYITGETTDKTGAPIYPTDRTKKVLGAHSFEFGMEDYGPGADEQLGDDTRLTSEDAAGYWVQDLGQPEGEMPTTWDEIRQEIMSAEKSRGTAERVAKGHVSKSKTVDDGEEEAKYAAEQDERKSEEASHEEQAAIEGERGSMQNVIDMLKGESGAIATGGKVADPLYSNAAKAVSDITMPKAPASQWLSMLDPAKGKGTKADEMKWIGLDDYLKEKGDQNVSKQEIQDFIEQNKVKLEEVRKGGHLDIDEAWTVPSEDVEDGLTFNFKDEDGNIFTINNDQGDWTLYNDRGDVMNTAETIKEAAEKYGFTKKDYVGSTEIKEGTKFSSYQLPGGENYREVLLRLPGEDKLPEGYKLKYLGEGAVELQNPKGQFIGQYPSKQAAIRASAEWFGSPTYKSPHWDEPNVLAHMRLNGRVDADGKKVLFVEEIQSDWHQAGRKQGYAGDITKDEAQKLGYSVYRAKSNLGTEGYFIEGPSNRRDIPATGWDTEAEAWNGVLDFIKEKTDRKVPPAPFSKTWHELAFKRILREAAEKGYDKVAWTTGEQQAARYDLSKQISKVTYQPKNETLVVYDVEGRKVIDESGVAPEKIEDYIGKDPAKKLLEQPVDDKMGWTAEEKYGGFVVKKPDGKYYEINNRLFVGTKAQTEGIIKRNAGVVEQSIEGPDLKVGGEGMKGFYDKILVDYANKYGKKWGAKVTDEDILPSVRKLKWQVEFENGPMKYYDTEAEAKKAMNELDGISVSKQEGATGVHSMTITPAMRASVMGEGQPMFAVTGGAGIAGTLAAMQASRDKNKKGVSDVVSRIKSKRK